jgi:hypothetical protein
MSKKKQSTDKKKCSTKTGNKNKARVRDCKKTAASNNAQTTEKIQFLELLYQLCMSVKGPQPELKRDRLPVPEMLYSLVYKVYLQVSYRTHISFLDEIQKLNYLTRKPASSSINNYMRSAEITALLERLLEKTILVMKLENVHAAIDSTRLLIIGNYTTVDRTGRVVWHRKYIRLHVIVDIKTHLVLAAKIGKHYEDEKRFFEPLLRLAQRRCHIITIAGDKNYSSEACMKIAEALGCKPFLTPKKNNKSNAKKRSSSWNDNLERYRQGTEEDRRRFSQRKQIETVFSMIKLRFTRELASEYYQAQLNEALCLAICHNLRILIFNREMHESTVDFPSDEPG